MHPDATLREALCGCSSVVERQLPNRDGERATATDETGNEKGSSGPSDFASGEIDPRLIAVIQGWPRLPEVVRKGILGMVQAVE